jgi:hypothetical protein
MAANPSFVPQAKLASEAQTLQIVEPSAVTLKKRIRDLLLEIFEGHEEFLGRTPD